MSTVNNGVKRNNIEDSEVSEIAKTLYDNIFKVNVIEADNSSHYFYNLLNKVYLPESLNGDVYEEISLDRKMSWTHLSYKLYGSIDFWWLIVLVNKPDYIFMAEAGVSYKYIKPNVVDTILAQMNS